MKLTGMGDERSQPLLGNQEPHVDSNLAVAQADGGSDAEYLGEDAECLKEWGVTIEQEVSIISFHLFKKTQKILAKSFSQINDVACIKPKLLLRQYM